MSLLRRLKYDLIGMTHVLDLRYETLAKWIEKQLSGQKFSKFLSQYCINICMNKNELMQLVNQGMTQRQIADKLGFSQGNVKYWLAKFGMKTKYSVPKKLECKICGETNPDLFYWHKDGRTRYRCKKCDNRETIKRFRQNKKDAVEYKGGKCNRCGYNKCIGSLDFHHSSPKQKDPNWKRMRTWPLDKIKKELDKCELVCRNCHGEIHYELTW